MKQRYKINNLLELKVPELTDAKKLYELIEHSRQEMQKWLPWVKKTLSAADEEAFILYSLGRIQDGKLWSMTICVDGVPAGSIDIHEINVQNAHGQIGYWLGSRFQGKGIMTQTLEATVAIAFEELGLHRLELIADNNNQKSKAVAVRAGFAFNCILQDYLLSQDGFHDAVLYSKLSALKKPQFIEPINL
ncbi:GNAT family N-acetyltransferase [Liquorilactobacillus oeni]|uniref:N-acetyltransferase GCN5 n=1 Tax=Liquorilactobacillus oeni DSM 19972 TaxID=1423777 RepID=A0A0R1MF08_9LACO|nr:GNAT family protein [Liquorilactobacillus oeni]KRL04484.1 N-acetyltransferase GCN5 [Liquorilactobacillus oeni DSM 19972]